MSSQPLVTSRVQIPEEHIRAALASVAVPGYTGSVYIEISLAAEAAQYVSFSVLRRQSKTVNEGPVKQVLPDPERRKPVEKVLGDIREKLCLRPVMVALEVHVVNGVLHKLTIQE